MKISTKQNNNSTISHHYRNPDTDTNYTLPAFSVHLALFRVLPEHPASPTKDDVTSSDTIQHQYQKDSRTACHNISTINGLNKTY